MAAKKSELELNFASVFFNALRALYDKNLQPPIANAHVFNNINEYTNSLKTGQNAPKETKGNVEPNDLALRLKNIAENKLGKLRNRKRDPRKLEHLMKVKSQTDGIVEKVAMLEKTTRKASQMNLLERMEDKYKEGPLSILYNCVEKKTKLKVWTRHLQGLRGVCVGYLIAFDKHMNLAMMDVDEMFSIEEEILVDPIDTLRRTEKKREKKRTWRRKKRVELRKNEGCLASVDEGDMKTENGGEGRRMEVKEDGSSNSATVVIFGSSMRIDIANLGSNGEGDFFGSSMSIKSERIDSQSNDSLGSEKDASKIQSEGRSDVYIEDLKLEVKAKESSSDNVELFESSTRVDIGRNLSQRQSSDNFDSDKGASKIQSDVRSDLDMENLKMEIKAKGSSTPTVELFGSSMKIKTERTVSQSSHSLGCDKVASNIQNEGKCDLDNEDLKMEVKAKAISGTTFELFGSSIKIKTESTVSQSSHSLGCDKGVSNIQGDLNTEDARVEITSKERSSDNVELFESSTRIDIENNGKHDPQCSDRSVSKIQCGKGKDLDIENQMKVNFENIANDVANNKSRTQGDKTGLEETQGDKTGLEETHEDTMGVEVTYKDTAGVVWTEEDTSEVMSGNFCSSEEQAEIEMVEEENDGKELVTRNILTFEEETFVGLELGVGSASGMNSDEEHQKIHGQSISGYEESTVLPVGTSTEPAGILEGAEKSTAVKQEHFSEASIDGKSSLNTDSDNSSSIAGDSNEKIDYSNSDVTILGIMEEVQQTESILDGTGDLSSSNLLSEESFEGETDVGLEDNVGSTSNDLPSTVDGESIPDYIEHTGLSVGVGKDSSGALGKAGNNSTLDQELYAEKNMDSGYVEQTGLPVGVSKDSSDARCNLNTDRSKGSPVACYTNEEVENLDNQITISGILEEVKRTENELDEIGNLSSSNVLSDDDSFKETVGEDTDDYMRKDGQNTSNDVDNNEVTISSIMDEVKQTESVLEEAGKLLPSDRSTNTHLCRPMVFDDESRDSVIFEKTVDQERSTMFVQSVTLHHSITYGLEESRGVARHGCEDSGSSIDKAGCDDGEKEHATGDDGDNGGDDNGGDDNGGDDGGGNGSLSSKAGDDDGNFGKDGGSGDDDGSHSEEKGTDDDDDDDNGGDNDGGGDGSGWGDDKSDGGSDGTSVDNGGGDGNDCIVAFGYAKTFDDDGSDHGGMVAHDEDTYDDASSLDGDGNEFDDGEEGSEDNGAVGESEVTDCDGNIGGDQGDDDGSTGRGDDNKNMETDHSGQNVEAIAEDFHEDQNTLNKDQATTKEITKGGCPSTDDNIMTNVTRSDVHFPIQNVEVMEQERYEHQSTLNEDQATTEEITKGDSHSKDDNSVDNMTNTVVHVEIQNIEVMEQDLDEDKSILNEDQATTEEITMRGSQSKDYVTRSDVHVIIQDIEVMEQDLDEDKSTFNEDQTASKVVNPQTIDDPFVANVTKDDNEFGVRTIKSEVTTEFQVLKTEKGTFEEIDLSTSNDKNNETQLQNLEPKNEKDGTKFDVEQMSYRKDTCAFVQAVNEVSKGELTKSGDEKQFVERDMKMREVSVGSRDVYEPEVEVDETAANIDGKEEGELSSSSDESNMDCDNKESSKTKNSGKQTSGKLAKSQNMEVECKVLNQEKKQNKNNSKIISLSRTRERKSDIGLKRHTKDDTAPKKTQRVNEIDKRRHSSSRTRVSCETKEKITEESTVKSGRERRGSYTEREASTSRHSSGDKEPTKSRKVSLDEARKSDRDSVKSKEKLRSSSTAKKLEVSSRFKNTKAKESKSAVPRQDKNSDKEKATKNSAKKTEENIKLKETEKGTKTSKGSGDRRARVDKDDKTLPDTRSSKVTETSSKSTRKHQRERSSSESTSKQLSKSGKELMNKPGKTESKGKPKVAETVRKTSTKDRENKVTSKNLRSEKTKTSEQAKQGEGSDDKDQTHPQKFVDVVTTSVASRESSTVASTSAQMSKQEHRTESSTKHHSNRKESDDKKRKVNQSHCKQPGDIVKTSRNSESRNVEDHSTRTQKSERGSSAEFSTLKNRKETASDDNKRLNQSHLKESGNIDKTLRNRESPKVEDHSTSKHKSKQESSSKTSNRQSSKNRKDSSDRSDDKVNQRHLKESGDIDKTSIKTESPKVSNSSKSETKPKRDKSTESSTRQPLKNTKDSVPDESTRKVSQSHLKEDIGKRNSESRRVSSSSKNEIKSKRENSTESKNIKDSVSDEKKRKVSQSHLKKSGDIGKRKTESSIVGNTSKSEKTSKRESSSGSNNKKDSVSDEKKCKVSQSRLQESGNIVKRNTESPKVSNSSKREIKSERESSTESKNMKESVSDEKKIKESQNNRKESGNIVKRNMESHKVVSTSKSETKVRRESCSETSSKHSTKSKNETRTIGKEAKPIRDIPDDSKKRDSRKSCSEKPSSSKHIVRGAARSGDIQKERKEDSKKTISKTKDKIVSKETKSGKIYKREHSGLKSGDNLSVKQESPIVKKVDKFETGKTDGEKGYSEKNSLETNVEMKTPNVETNVESMKTNTAMKMPNVEVNVETTKTSVGMKMPNVEMDVDLMKTNAGMEITNFEMKKAKVELTKVKKKITSTNDKKPEQSRKEQSVSNKPDNECKNEKIPESSKRTSTKRRLSSEEKRSERISTGESRTSKENKNKNDNELSNKQIARDRNVKSKKENICSSKEGSQKRDITSAKQNDGGVKNPTSIGKNVKSETRQKVVAKRSVGDYKRRLERENRSASKNIETRKTVKTNSEISIQSKTLKKSKTSQPSAESKQSSKANKGKLSSKRKRENTPERPKKVRKTTKKELKTKTIKTKGAQLPGKVVTVRLLKAERGKALVLKRRHVNQLFIRGDNIIMVAHDNVASAEMKLGEETLSNK